MGMAVSIPHGGLRTLSCVLRGSKTNHARVAIPHGGLRTGILLGRLFLRGNVTIPHGGLRTAEPFQRTDNDHVSPSHTVGLEHEFIPYVLTASANSRHPTRWA